MGQQQQHPLEPVRNAGPQAARRPAASEPLGRGPDLCVPTSPHPRHFWRTLQSENLGPEGFCRMQQAGVWTAGNRCDVCNKSFRCSLCSPKRCLPHLSLRRHTPGGTFHEKRQVFPEGSRLETGVRDLKVYRGVEVTGRTHR